MRDGEQEDELFQCAARGEHGLEGLQGPDGHQYGQDQEGRPGLEDLTEAVGRRGGAARAAEAAHHRCATGYADHFAVFGALGLPGLQEQGQGHQAHQGGGDVGQFRADEVGGEVLGHGEAGASHQGCRPGFLDAAPAIHHGHQPEGHDDRQERQLAAGHGADLEGVDAGHLAGDDDRDAQGAESHRRGVGDQAQAGRIERVEAQAHQQGGGDGHRGAEAGGAFEECTEGEADQQHLQALVIGDGQHGAADHLELAALDREFVEEHRRDDDPGDGPEAVGEAVSGGGERHVRGHLEGEDRNRQ
ncbi:hypothetical protein D9M71_57580 [compost metagenome]